MLKEKVLIKCRIQRLKNSKPKIYIKDVEGIFYISSQYCYDGNGVNFKEIKDFKSGSYGYIEAKPLNVYLSGLEIDFKTHIVVNLPNGENISVNKNLVKDFKSNTNFNIIANSCPMRQLCDRATKSLFPYIESNYICRIANVMGGKISVLGCKEDNCIIVHVTNIKER